MNETETLSGLVRKALADRGVSGRQLAAQADRAGHRVTHTTLNHLAAGTYRFAPTPDTIRAIAWAAGVSESVAFRAAGVPMPGPPFAAELPPGVDYLSQPSRKAAVEVLRALVRAEQAGENRGDGPPMNHAGESPAHLVTSAGRPADDDVSDVDYTLAALEGEEITREFEERESETP